MPSCESPLSETTPSSPVHPTAHLCDVTGGPAAAAVAGTSRRMTDTAKMLSPRLSATYTAAKTGGGALPAELSQSSPHPYQHRHQQHPQPCVGSLSDPFFLTVIDENVQTFSSTASTSGSRTSLSGDSASTSARDATLCGPCVDCVPPTRGGMVCKSRPACELRLECLPSTSMAHEITKDEAGDSKRKRRQPSSLPSSSHWETAGLFSRVEVTVPTVEVAAADKAVTATAATVTDPEAELKSHGSRSRSPLTTRATAWASTLRGARTPSMELGLASGSVHDGLPSPRSASLSNVKPGSDSRDAPQGSHVLECKTASLPGKRVDTAMSTSSSTVCSYARKAQEGSAKEVMMCAIFGGATPRSKMTLPVPLMMWSTPSRTGPPHSAFCAQDGAANSEQLPLLETYPPNVLPSSIEEVSLGVEYDVTSAPHNDNCSMKDMAVTLKEVADQRQRILAEEPNLQVSPENRRTVHTQWPIHPLLTTACLFGRSIMGASFSTLLWRTALWSRPAIPTPCSCASARTDQQSAQVLSTGLSHESAVPKKYVIDQRYPSSFTTPMLYMLPPPSFLAHKPALLSTKRLAMSSWVEIHRASPFFSHTWSIFMYAHRPAVPPLLATGSTAFCVPSTQHLALLPLPDNTSSDSVGIEKITRFPSHRAAEAEEVVDRKSRDMWRLARCYAHFERAVEQRGDGGVWSARGVSSLTAWDSVGLVAGAGVAKSDMESSRDDDCEDSGPCLFPSFTFDAPRDKPAPVSSTSPQLTSTFPFSSVASVLRAEKEEEDFASAVMWALERMTGAL
ncbi:hypothetical protein, unknown function [Leishmania tarentolae]|uniref:Uncharacterized protein n=1 Tax=Leishmania tarentolae TaxID=5689 RepID=A0A640KB45_LEITA|nr:hypothetical protein, unknown function [Leishmania tarentolae]